MRPSRFGHRVTDRLPEPVRQVIRDEVKVVNERMRSVRRPKDLRRLLKDPAFVADLSEPLAPVLDRLLGLVARGTLPISPRLARNGATTSAVIGATAESAMEIAAVVGIEAPPIAATVASSAFGIGIAVQLVEFYLTAGMVWGELNRAGHPDVAALRRALLAAYLGDGRHSGDLSQLGLNRIAVALVKRAVPTYIPLAGIPIAGVSAHRAQKRARAAVTTEITRRSRLD